jgi:hypothetical protein
MVEEAGEERRERIMVSQYANRFCLSLRSGRTIGRAGAQKQNNTSGEFYSSGRESDTKKGSAEEHEPRFVRCTWDSLSLSVPKMDPSRDHGPIKLGRVDATSCCTMFGADMEIPIVLRPPGQLARESPVNCCRTPPHVTLSLASADATTTHSSCLQQPAHHLCGFHRPSTASLARTPRTQSVHRTSYIYPRVLKTHHR